MTDFVRVRDERTGHEYSTAAVREGMTVLDEPAVSRNGRPLPPKHVELREEIVEIASLPIITDEGPSSTHTEENAE